MIRRVTKVEYDTGQFYILPLYRAVQETQQDLSQASVILSGASYEYDLLGAGVSPKRNATERLSFLLLGDNSAEVNSGLDVLRRILYVGASLRIWTEGDVLDEHSEPVTTLRWATARVLSMPQVQIETNSINALPIVVIMSRSTDWNDEDPIQLAPESIAGSMTFNNLGNARILDAILTINGSYASPVITNTRNGSRFQSVGSGSKLRIDAGRSAVEKFESGQWLSDLGAYIRPSGQIQLFTFEIGENILSISGATGTLEINAYSKWH